MLGIIAWIRPDGRKAFVIVAGSEQLVPGDPGLTKGESLKVGDLVRMPNIKKDLSDFRTGLILVRSGFWPQIVRDIGKISKGQTLISDYSNVIDLGEVRKKASKATYGERMRRLAAE